MPKLSRRNVLGATGLALGGSLLGEGVIAQTDDAGSVEEVPWPQLQFDAARSGNADATGPTENLRPSWRFQDVGAYGLASAPAVADGTLYFLSTDTGDGGSAEDGYSGIVHAVDTAGSEVWRTRTTVSQSSLAVTGGLVIVGGRGGPLQALDASTGERQWSFGDGPWFEGSPTVVDGTVFFPSETYHDGIVFALNAADGSQEWSVGVDLLGSPMAVTGVAVANETAYFAVGTDAGVGALYAVDAATGEQHWRVDLPRAGGGTGNVATPTVVDGRVFFATNNALFAFGPDGTEQWRVEIGGFLPRFFTEQSPAVADGTVYFPDGEGLVAADAATGDRRWTFEPSSVTVSSSPVVVDGAVYVGTEGAGTYVLDPATGNPLGQYRSGKNVRVIVPPVAVDGTAYVGGFTEAENPAPGLTALESGDAAASAEPSPAFGVVHDEILRGMPVSFENRSDTFGDFDATSGDAEFRWNFDGDGEVDRTTASTDEIAEHSFEKSGQHEVTLTVKNSYGWTASTTNTVEVSEETYERPTARIETEPPNAEEKTFASGETVTLDASASSGGSRAITSYEWDVDGYGTTTGERIDVELEGLCGEWRVVLTVTDELDVSDEATIGLVVGD